MPAGFKKTRTRGAGTAPKNPTQPTNGSATGPQKHDGRANPRGGANYETGGTRDTQDRILRDNRGGV